MLQTRDYARLMSHLFRHVLPIRKNEGCLTSCHRSARKTCHRGVLAQKEPTLEEKIARNACKMNLYHRNFQTLGFRTKSYLQSLLIQLLPHFQQNCGVDLWLLRGWLPYLFGNACWHFEDKRNNDLLGFSNGMEDNISLELCGRGQWVLLFHWCSKLPRRGTNLHLAKSLFSWTENGDWTKNGTLFAQENNNNNNNQLTMVVVMTAVVAPKNYIQKKRVWRWSMSM